MNNTIEKSLVIRKETVYEKIRKSLLSLIYSKDYQMMQRFEDLIKPKRPNKRIIIPREIGKEWHK